MSEILECAPRRVVTVNVRFDPHRRLPSFEPPKVEVLAGDILRFRCVSEPLTFWVYDHYGSVSSCLFGGNYAAYASTEGGTDLEVRGRPGSVYTVSLTPPQQRHLDALPLTLSAPEQTSAEFTSGPVVAAAPNGGRDGTIRVGP